MQSIKISDVRNFMNHLLAKETFDPFFLVRASIHTAVTYDLDGRINTDFFKEDDPAPETPFCHWSYIKPAAFQAIRGKRLPLSLKIILALPEKSVSYFLQKSGTSFKREEIEGMYLNILYDQNDLTLTTGVSYKTFQLDKSLEHYFDQSIFHFITTKIDPNASIE